LYACSPEASGQGHSELGSTLLYLRYASIPLRETDTPLDVLQAVTESGSEPPGAGDGGRDSPIWRTTAAKWADRSVAKEDADRSGAVPDGPAGRTCGCLHGLWAVACVVQFVPQPQLPQMPVARTRGLDTGPRSRFAARGLLSCGVHDAFGTQRAVPAQPAVHVRHAVRQRVGDAAKICCRPQMAGRTDRSDDGAAHLGPEPEPAPPRARHRAGRWIGYARPLAKKPCWWRPVFVPGEGDVAGISGHFYEKTVRGTGIWRVGTAGIGAGVLRPADIPGLEKRPLR